jgi:DASH complex subunit DAD2
MAYAHRQTTLSSHIRPSSGLANPSASTQSALLQARINEKKVELENLRQLRDLSAGLAGQMQQLEEKLSTLSSGTEAVAAVMGNWHNVLRAIHMASGAYIRRAKRRFKVLTGVQPKYQSRRRKAQRRRHRYLRHSSAYRYSRQRPCRKRPMRLRKLQVNEIAHLQED